VVVVLVVLVLVDVVDVLLEVLDVLDVDTGPAVAVGTCAAGLAVVVISASGGVVVVVTVVVVTSPDSPPGPPVLDATSRLHAPAESAHRPATIKVARRSTTAQKFTVTITLGGGTLTYVVGFAYFHV
jgi:hypothetical protein